MLPCAQSFHPPQHAWRDLPQPSQDRSSLQRPEAKAPAAGIHPHIPLPGHQQQPLLFFLFQITLFPEHIFHLLLSQLVSKVSLSGENQSESSYYTARVEGRDERA